MALLFMYGDVEAARTATLAGRQLCSRIMEEGDDTADMSTVRNGHLFSQRCSMLLRL